MLNEGVISSIQDDGRIGECVGGREAHRYNFGWASVGFAQNDVEVQIGPAQV